MGEKIPESKLRRGLTGTGTAMKVGGGVLGYYALKPFRSREGQKEAKRRLDEKNAQAIFQALTLLRGTVLKLAQMVSMEMDLLPESLRKELQKSYNQVPPINRALARKVVRNAFGRPPEEVFRSLDLTAFAAASLGQVHRAEAPDGSPLAVKLQYPGIGNTIVNDMQLLRTVLKPLAEYDIILPALEEIEARLLEEIDYVREAGNMAWFADNLGMENVFVPRPWEPGCGRTVLSATFMEGLPLNEWIAANPPQEDRNRVAQRLNDIFLRCLYELNRIHADPNPGNFIIGGDLSISLVDFGCVKRFDPEFVRLYSILPRLIIGGRQEEYFATLRALNFTGPGLDKETEGSIFKATYEFGHWLGKFYETDKFDFSDCEEIIEAGKAHMQAMYSFRKYIAINPEIIFLNRTRYGLLKTYQQLGAQINLQNPYEMDL